VAIQADVGTVLTVEASYTDDRGSAERVASTPTAAVTDVNDAPVLGNNALTLSAGETVVINPAMLSASDVDDPAPGLIFSVSGVAGGQFERTIDPGVAITSFSQAEVAAGQVVFVDDGDAVAPAYSVTVSDGTASVGPTAANVDFLMAAAVATTAPPPDLPPLISLPPLDGLAATETSSAPTPPAAELGTANDAEDTETIDKLTETEDPGEAATLEDSGAPLVTEVVADIDAGNPAPANPLQALLKSLVVRQAALGAATAQATLADTFEVDALAAEIRTVLTSSAFNEGLDRVRQEIADSNLIHRTAVGSGIAVTTGLSVGYVAWLVRGGVLLSTALSSLPAWQFVDPLPVLARTRDDEDRDETEGDSLEGIIKEQSAEAANRAHDTRASDDTNVASEHRRARS
jgi:hypothetical protein